MGSNTKVLVVHPGTQHAYQLVSQLHRHNCLYEFHTLCCLSKLSIGFKILKKLVPNFARKISARTINDIPSKEIKNYYLIEVKDLLRKKFSKKNQEDLLYQRNKEFQLAIDDDIIKAVDVIIGFDTSSFILVEKAKKFGKIFILDQTIAHPLLKEKIFSKINRLNNYQTFTRKDEALINLEHKEHDLSTYITVASTFSKTSLIENGIKENKIFVNPYGVDVNRFTSKKTDRNILRFIYVGSLTTRKGIDKLIKIWQEINAENAELWIVGPGEIPSGLSLCENIKFLGKIPNSDLQKVLINCDVFILPSFFEGFGLVLLEAMSCGLTIITTTSTAGPDLIEHQKQGFIYDAFELHLLKEHILFFLKNPKEAKRMGDLCKLRANNFTWEAYGHRWINTINNLINSQC